MRNGERVLLREKLDHEQRIFRVAAKKAPDFPQWLRRVRQGLGLQAREMARELGVNVSVIFRLEKSEEQKSISLRALEKMAEAMGCKLVYAIVPRGGKTLAELAEERVEEEAGRGRDVGTRSHLINTLLPERDVPQVLKPPISQGVLRHG